MAARSFPPNFLFGVATAAYQIEGAWDADGKGENIWDHLTHTNPQMIVDGSNGDVACDSYHRYKEDVKAAKDMCVDFYRFSISWARILPNGVMSTVNETGMNYYKKLIVELLENGIQPVATMHHWDLPQPLQEMGGWMNPLMADFFEDYARILFEHLGDMVKWWITFNEPGHTARSYTHPFLFAPCYSLLKQGANYLATKTILKAHARVYHMYNQEFRQVQSGKVGITLHCHWYEPKSNTELDNEASIVALQFDLGIFAHPIFKTGDFPDVVKEKVAAESKTEGLARSRLPEIEPEWAEKIKNTADFFGLNHYSTRLAELSEVSHWWLEDSGVQLSFDHSWPETASDWLKVVPWGLYKLLNWIKVEYGNPPLFITENGFSDSGALCDKERIGYYTKYLNALLNALEDGCNVFGYTAWSLIDNYEWLRGYSEKFGLYHVDFSDPNRPRTAKDSSKVLREIFVSKKIWSHV